eukprot:gene6057-5922_t
MDIDDPTTRRRLAQAADERYASVRAGQRGRPLPPSARAAPGPVVPQPPPQPPPNSHPLA